MKSSSKTLPLPPTRATLSPFSRMAATLPILPSDNENNNDFDSIKMSSAWSLAEQIPPQVNSVQCDCGKLPTSTPRPPCQSNHKSDMSLASSSPTSPQTEYIDLSEISTSDSKMSHRTDEESDCQRALFSEVFPAPLSDDQCLQVLSQSMKPTNSFEKYLRRLNQKDRERLKKSQVKVKRWWLSGGNSASKKLTCAKCNRQFHKAYGLQAHSLRCQVSCAPKRKFQCEICQSKLRMVGVKRHMVNKHQLKIEEYGALYFRRLFNCKICEVDIDMNKASVVGHMEKVHFLSLDKYCEHYGALHSHRSPGD